MNDSAINVAQTLLFLVFGPGMILDGAVTRKRQNVMMGLMWTMMGIARIVPLHWQWPIIACSLFVFLIWMIDGACRIINWIRLRRLSGS